jgi:hypothetical protein
LRPVRSQAEFAKILVFISTVLHYRRGIVPEKGERALKTGRKHERKSVSYPGWVRAGEPTLIRCLIEDVSQGGARLMVDRQDRFPPRFALFFSPTGNNFRDCVVRWRRANRIGVQFCKTAASSEAPAAAAARTFVPEIVEI